MDTVGLRALMQTQKGVVSRRQVLIHGGSDVDIARLLRRRILNRVHDGVYVDHTGPLSDRQRAWAAVLVHWPAVLSGGWSLAMSGMRGVRLPATIEIAVDHRRRVDEALGVAVRRMRRLDDFARWNLSPPRTSVEHAVLLEASRAIRDDAAVAVLADACQSRLTTAGRLQATLDELPGLPRRAFLGEVLADVAAGAFSALERRYLARVECAHGLPAASRQATAISRAGVAYRDVHYRAWRVAVELDGRLGHEWTSETWDDLDRDVSTTVGGGVTVRAGWRMVLDPCRLATSIAAILKARGWQGHLRPCGPSCAAVDRGASHAPGAEDPPHDVGAG